MTDKKLPYMPWFTGDWQGSRSVRLMSLAARGLYREMIDLAWDQGEVPDSPGMVARMAGVPKSEVLEVWGEVRGMFTAVGDKLTLPKVERLRGRAKNRNLRRGSGGAYDPDAKIDATSDAEPDAKSDAPQAQAQTYTQAETQKGAKKRRVNGKDELEQAFSAYTIPAGSAPSPELREAAEAYRQSRVSGKKPAWRRAQWESLWEEAGYSSMALIPALKKAAQSGWASVHPKAASGKTGRRDRNEDDYQRLKAKLAAPRTIDVEGTPR